MKRLIHPSIAVLSSVALLSTVGCASAPPQLAGQMVKSESSIESAERSGAREYGAAALERARVTLKSAEAAADRKDYDSALRMAREAELDAKLAAAQTAHKKAQQSLDEIIESIETLRREITRNQQRQGGTS